MKDEFDFSEWDEGKFDSLVVSIKEFGVLHPIIVRQSPDSDIGCEAIEKVLDSSILIQALEAYLK